jgi:hypothetical protein
MKKDKKYKDSLIATFVSIIAVIIILIVLIIEENVLR